jgi:plastocyanin
LLRAQSYKRRPALFESRLEVLGWAAAILIVAAMGVIVLLGTESNSPFHKVNKVAAAPGKSYPMLHVKILDDPKTVGRYVPKTITAHVGQTVAFANVSGVDHTVTARSNAFNSGNLGVDSGWNLTLKKTGTFAYYCIYHPGMLGTIKVVR